MGRSVGGRVYFYRFPWKNGEMFDQSSGNPIERSSGTGSEEFGAGPETDYFRDPASAHVIASAPFIYEELSGDFTMTARVEPQFSATYDAGGLLLMVDDEHWLKLAYENTDIGYPAIVSVATNGRSDDCNGEKWSTGSVLLRMSRKGGALGCYYGKSVGTLKMKRLLRVPGLPTTEDSGGAIVSTGPLRIGLTVQSPKGSGTRARFTEIELRSVGVEDMRRGV